MDSQLAEVLTSILIVITVLVINRLLGPLRDWGRKRDHDGKAGWLNERHNRPYRYYDSIAARQKTEAMGEDSDASEVWTPDTNPFEETAQRDRAAIAAERAARFEHTDRDTSVAPSSQDE